MENHTAVQGHQYESNKSICRAIKWMLRGDEISNQIEGKNGRVANVEIHTG